MLSWHLARSPAVPDASFANFTLDGTSWLVYYDNTTNSSTVVDWLAWAPGERFVQSVFTTVLTDLAPSSRSPLVLDVGANAGFYGFMALAKGARVAFFDAQPECWRWIDAALRANRHRDRARFARHRAQRVAAAITTSTAAAPSTITVSTASGCDGQFSVGVGAATPSTPAATQHVPLVALHAVPGMVHDALAATSQIDLVKVSEWRGEPMACHPLPSASLLRASVDQLAPDRTPWVRPSR
jgi:hypothetical protein